MDVMENLRVTELLASRICHDLISPVGAINNGLELLEEMGAQVGGEAVKLIGHSAEQAARRLRLFRVCYGAAGADANLSCDDVLSTLRDYLTGSRVSISWSAEALKAIPNPPRGLAKVLLNMGLIGVELLVHGGTLTALTAENTVTLQVQGRGAGTREDPWQPLTGDVPVDALTARSIHPYVTGRFAKHYGITPSWQIIGEDQAVLTLAFTPVA